MRFLSNAALAFAIISSSLLSPTLAAPTPQTVNLGEQDGQNTLASRQCVMSHYANIDGSQDNSTMMPRQIMIHPAKQGDTGDRQMMMSMGADEEHVYSRQIHGGLMAEEGEVQGRQIMAASSADEGDVQSRQVYGGPVSEERETEEMKVAK